MDKLLTVSEAAVLLGVTDRTLQRKIKSGTIAAVMEKATAGGGRGGVAYMIPLEKLPKAVQEKYWKVSRKKERTEKGKDRLPRSAQKENPPCSAEHPPLKGRAGVGAAVGNNPPCPKRTASGSLDSPPNMGAKRKPKYQEETAGEIGIQSDSWLDVARREQEEKAAALAKSGRPKTLEECSAGQREQVDLWKEILDGWQAMRSEAVGRKLEMRKGEVLTPQPAGSPPNMGAMGRDGGGAVSYTRRAEQSPAPTGWADSHTSLQEVDEAFARRLYDQRGLEVSVQTIYRKWSLYNQFGDVGLVDMRGACNAGRSKIEKEAWTQFETLWLDQSQRNLSTCYEFTQKWAEMFATHLLPLPSYTTFKRTADKIPFAVTMLARYGEKKYEDAAMPYITRIYEDIESNDIWVGDNHTLDIISRYDGTDVQHRLYLSMFVDVRSRMPVGWNICLSANSDSTLVAFRMGVKRCGMPKTVYVDNGREYLVSDFGGRGHRKAAIAKDPLPPTILNRMGIKMINALPENAKAKIIERVFREFAEWFSKGFQTYIGRNPVERPERTRKKLEVEDMVLDSNIREWIGLYIEGFYSVKAQHGMGMNGKTPIQVWEENLLTKRMASEDELNLMLLRTSRPQTVRREGVVLKLYGQVLHYWNEDFIMEWQGRKVYARFDPNDLTTVRVYDAADKVIGTLPCRDDLVMSYMASKEQIQAAHKSIRGFTKKVAGDLKTRGGGMGSLDIMIASAMANRRSPDGSGAVTEMARYFEESADNPLGLAKAVGDIDEGAELFARMRRNAERGRE